VKNSFFTRLLVPAALLLSHCGRPEEPTPPAQLLPREKMVGLLADIHVLEAQVEASRISPDSSRVLFTQQVKSIYKRYNTDEATLKQSMEYYAIHGKDLEEIYGIVVDTLSMREVRMNSNK
jgi:hypothetical protein